VLLNNISVRAFKNNDFKQVQNIYSQGIATGIATFETKVPNWEQWNAKYIKSCRIVAENEKRY